MPLYFFYTMVQKSKKWPKTQNKGSCLNHRTTGKRLTSSTFKIKPVKVCLCVNLDLLQDTLALWNFDWGMSHTWRGVQEAKLKDKVKSELHGEA